MRDTLTFRYAPDSRWATNARRRAGVVIGTGLVVLTVSLAVALFGGRDYRNPNGGSQTRVEGKSAITTHQTPPVFGDDLTARYDLPVRNWWDEPIHITDIIPSCSCSKAELASRELPPKGETKLQVEVEFPPNGGEREISCVLETREGKRLSHGFTAIAYPYVQLANEDGAVSLGEVMPGRVAETSQTLYLHASKDAGAPPEIVSVEAESPAVTAWVEPSSSIEELPGGYGLRAAAALHLNLRPGTYPGPGGTNLAVKYRGRGFSGSYLIHVRWTVTQLFSLEPSRLFITIDHKQVDPFPKSVWLRSVEDRPFRVLSVKSSVPWIRVHSGIPSGVLPISDISFVIHPSYAETKAFTELEIVTDHPSHQIVRLPVSLFRVLSSDSGNARQDTGL